MKSTQLHNSTSEDNVPKVTALGNITPHWVKEQHAEVEQLLAPLIDGKNLIGVQYDVHPDVQALEIYLITLKHNQQAAKAYAAYIKDETPIVTIHLTPLKLTSNE